MSPSALRISTARLAVIALGASVFLPPPRPARAQPTAPPGGVESAARGLALIDSAIAAHGGMDRLRAVEDLTIRYRGRRWMAYQSTSLARPWVTQPTFAD